MSANSGAAANVSKRRCPSPEGTGVSCHRPAASSSIGSDEIRRVSRSTMSAENAAASARLDRRERKNAPRTAPPVDQK
jgi:hypothetical protein